MFPMSLSLIQNSFIKLHLGISHRDLRLNIIRSIIREKDESKYQPNIFLEYSPQVIVHTFVVLTDRSFHIKKQIDLKKEKVDFYQNGSEMLDWIDERYDITSFEKYQDRQVLQVLVVILGKKTQIETNEAMMRMSYNIIEAHTYYDFSTFISNEVRKNLLNIKKSNFYNSSYLCWLIVHQNLEDLAKGGLQVELETLSTTPKPIDFKVLVLKEFHGL